MIFFKTEDEIALLRLSNKLVAQTLGEVAKHIKPGVSTLELDKVAEKFIRDNGGIPAFLNYHGFPNTLCTSVNDQVVHGIPSKRPLVEGDIVSVDVGVLMNEFYGDSAYTFAVGSVSDEAKKLLEVTKASLYKGIEASVAGHRLGDIGSAIQTYCESHNYTVVREMVGHGIGRNLHEAPEVPNYGKRGSGLLLKEGMVIAIEPMINAGRRNIIQESDGWTIRTIDKKLSAHFEHSIVIRKNGAEVLSSFDFIEEVLSLQS